PAGAAEDAGAAATAILGAGAVAARSDAGGAPGLRRAARRRPVNAGAAWVVETLASACAAPKQGAAEITYPSSGLPGSEAAWEYFDRGDAEPPVLQEGGLLDFGDGVEDVVASAFWHLSRWEERAGSPRDRHGRFTAANALADPEQPAGAAALGRFPGAAR